MIVLGKDKIDERFNILEDGTIVDLNGNVQELKIAKGRSYFKSIAVHKIQMWTNYDYKDTKIWVVHHKDKNPLNNSLSNLCFLTRSKHNVLHKKGNKNFLGKHLSEEHKRRISERMKGKNHPLYGKHWTLSEETKKKISDGHKGLNTWTKSLRWFNDGIKNYFCKECPKGCVPGKINFNHFCN